MDVRLCSPRGKLKITNVADDQVALTPEDIPDASFIKEEMEKLTVSQLKFWLECLRINQNSNEKELLPVRCTSSDFARSISCFCCLFSTKSLHSGLDTCVQNLLSQGHEPGSNEKSKMNDPNPDPHWSFTNAKLARQ